MFCVIASASAAPALAGSSPTRELIRDRIEHLAPGKSRQDAWLATGLQKFYEDRKFEPAWDPRRLDQLIAALKDFEDDGLDPADYQFARLRERRSVFREDAGRSARRRADLDLMATRACLLALLHLSLGKVDPAALDPAWNYEPRAFESKAARRAIKDALDGNRVDRMFATARPQHPDYARLRAALKSLRAIERAGGWPSIGAGPPLKAGMSDPRVAKLRQRLVAGGYLSGESTRGAEYDADVEAAVKQFQAEHYLEGDGKLGPMTRAALNVPVRTRIAQLRTNLERARWLLPRLQGDLVLVDIAGYKASLYRNGAPVWSSRVQVGRSVRPTPIIQGRITFITLNPPWTVPQTVLREDVLPKVRQDPGYLAAQRLHVVNARGEEVPPESVDWSAPDGPPGVWLRQEPGDGNAIGRIRINFPNPHDVFMHETPHTALFEKDQRAYSSGCIRVEDARGLTVRLLADPKRWSADALAAAIAEGETRDVGLKRPVPILLAYWTVDVRDDGRVTFKPDVYGLDPPLLQALDGAAAGARGGKEKPRR